MRRLLSVERHQKILERVASENAVDFASLADELGVSSMTVRRDLRILEEAGYLKTTRGGASAQLLNTQDILQHPRAMDQTLAKTQIGQYAASLIEKGEVIGLLNFEKEITGDIVQGLPRIEELLEARKKKPTNRNLATNQKKSLLIQKTSIDSSFEFQKLGTTIKENDKINPHNLLKVYFNYYGIKKQFFSSEDKFSTSYYLVNNYEASYRTFKKIQLLILNAVQSVYESQGVSIANKHLEVIIKQMTTKVLITHEGHTPLLPREVVDLYHIQYINEIIVAHNKRPAYYVPLLLGITKAALNNPSFISAASFQETTRVLTKAAIEGRVDWLRGLKENIIIGHLIPSGTGYQSYKNCFSRIIENKTTINLETNKIKI